MIVFIKNLFKNGLSLGLQFGTRWLFNLVLAMRLSNTDYGLFALVYMIGNIATPIMAFGSNFYIIHNLSKNSSRLILLSSILLTFIGSFSILLIFAFLPIQSMGLSITFFYLLIGLGIGFNWAFASVIYAYIKGQAKFGTELLLQCFSALTLGTFTYLTFVNTFSDIKNVIFWFYVISLVPATIGIFSVRSALGDEWKTIKKNSLSILTWAETKERSVYALHDFTAILFSNLPFIFMAIYAQIDDFGIFRKINILVVPLTLIPVILSQVLLNNMSEIKDHKKKLRAFFKLAVPLLLAGGAIWLTAFGFREEIFNIVLSENYSKENVTIFVLFLLTTFVIYARTFIEVLLTSMDAHSLRTKGLLYTLAASCIVYMSFSADLSGLESAYIFLISHSLFSVVLIAFLLYVYKRKKN